MCEINWSQKDYAEAKRLVTLYYILLVLFIALFTFLIGCQSVKNDALIYSGDVVIKTLEHYLEKDPELTDLEKKISLDACNEFRKLLKGE